MSTKRNRQPQLPRQHRPNRVPPPEDQPVSTGLSMGTVTPMIGFAAFPVAIGASFVGYIATGESRTIGVALVITGIAAVAGWLVLRSQPDWRRGVRTTNEFLAAVLVACAGSAVTIGGIAALSVVWIVAGIAMLAGAWLIQRLAPSATG